MRAKKGTGIIRKGSEFVSSVKDIVDNAHQLLMDLNPRGEHLGCSVSSYTIVIISSPNEQDTIEEHLYRQGPEHMRLPSNPYMLQATHDELMRLQHQSRGTFYARQKERPLEPAVTAADRRKQGRLLIREWARLKWKVNLTSSSNIYKMH